ncbi:PP2C family protein-serine/threonine phosphatase [Streptomyces virginiae]|uniref:PP2C family protein-serine/threonine phosphatase n=1 Tax=Streptomyces TaxID=1883 RepID=UPI00099C5D71|nr:MULTISPECIES: SpoIIE family protein phosphatase [Streptomyces]MCX4718682.1 SpoIIE family protein phosphatase [Streptomyces virginiae]MCX5276320.1 SpoIIE family protein phosphatase [Streptomyces virginiae]MYV80073.1 SpoIIE family protein phosphatase [Streptomyces sp. SID1046]
MASTLGLGARPPAPRTPSQQAANPRQASAAEPDDSLALWNGVPPYVLLIEDDEGDAVLVEELVEDSGIDVRLGRAASLAEALDMLADEAPECVLLDLNLPDAQGLDGLKKVLAVSAEAAVVVLTGLSEERAGLSAVAAGAQDYLVKGRLEPDVFMRAIRYAIQRKRTELAAVALEAGRLRAEENARLERGLLPTPLLRGDPADAVSVCARYHPGRAQTLLGGDFYDVVQTSDGSTHAVVGDVSGHGPSEAALGVCLRVAWRAFVMAGARDAELLGLLEQILLAERSGPEIFATLVSLTRAPGSRAVSVQRAGHPGFLVRSAAGVELRTVPGGPALGILPGWGAGWPVTEVPVEAGGAVMLFTDGLIEGRIGPGSDRLDEAGLLEIARKHTDLPAEPFVDSLIHAAQGLAADWGGLADDVAVLHLEWNTPT